MFAFRPLHDHFAAELHGIDLAKPLGAGQLAQLRQAWSRYAVLVIRGQSISGEQQLAFAKQFGALEQFPPPVDGKPGGPELVRVSNVRADGSVPGESDTATKYLALTRMWHKDGTYKRVPGFATVLRGEQVPAEGGETELVDLRVAFERLPRSEQQELARLAAVHSYGHAARVCGIEASDSLTSIAAIHPLVAWHDDGRRSLFLSPLHMQRIEGMSDGDGAALLAELVHWCAGPASIYRHAWQENDVLLWDNRTTMHRGLPPADQTEPRTLHRSVISGAGYVERLFVPREMPRVREA